MDTVVVRSRLSDCLDGTRCDEEAACREAQLRCIGEDVFSQSGTLDSRGVENGEK